MREIFVGRPGSPLTADAYESDYESRFAVSDGYDSWKLERQQHFKEPGNPSWEAFARGDWGKAIQLIESNREDWKGLAQEAARRNIALFRVRVVEEPFAPYLRWELHSLRVQAECGEKIRIVTREQIKEWEEDSPLPEILTVGPDTVYQVEYDADHALSGAVRFVDAAVATRCIEYIRKLYVLGEEIGELFNRKAASL